MDRSGSSRERSPSPCCTATRAMRCAGSSSARLRVRDPITDVSQLASAIGAQAARVMRALALPWTALVAFVVALAMASQWNTALQAIHRTPFGQTDPIWGRDIGWYVFTLPAIEAVVSFAFSLIILSLLLVAVPIHFARAETGRGGEPLVIPPHARQHLSMLAALLLLVLGRAHGAGEHPGPAVQPAPRRSPARATWTCTCACRRCTCSRRARSSAPPSSRGAARAGGWRSWRCASSWDTRSSRR